MSETDDAIDLLRAVLADNCGSDLAAGKHLAEAGRLGIDPLDYCAHRFGLGTEVVWRRAARWAGLQFATMTPSRLPLPPIARIDRLGDVRTLRQPVLGEDLVFAAPGFAPIINLRTARPETRARLRIVPPQAIEAGLARAANGQLIASAQTETTRLWPRASAAIDLPLSARIGFALLLALLVLAVMATGAVARPLFIPFAVVLLLVPSLLRLAAALPSPPRAAVPPLGDRDLPIYTVLIPLRDEAAMVPMLERAMLALDYPALCIKRTSGALSDRGGAVRASLCRSLDGGRTRRRLSTFRGDRGERSWSHGAPRTCRRIRCDPPRLSDLHPSRLRRAEQGTRSQA
ncbi:MAG: hypothetical protein ABI697_05060 [Devosia sp.]